MATLEPDRGTITLIRAAFSRYMLKSNKKCTYLLQVSYFARFCGARKEGTHLGPRSLTKSSIKSTMERRPENEDSIKALAKKQKVGENTENVIESKTQNSEMGKACKASADEGAKDELDTKSSIKDAVDEVKCAICFEPAIDDFKVSPHECGACRAACWSACEACNEALLSRACPFCKSDYAPKIFYQVPGRPLHTVMEPSIPPMEKIMTTIKIKFLNERVFPLANALCILPSGIAQFSLSKAGESEEVIIVRTKVKGSEIERGLKDIGDQREFHFMNKCWDLIEKVSEEADSEDNTAETLDSKTGSNKMIKACLTKGAEVYTPISLASWKELEEEWNAEF